MISQFEKLLDAIHRDAGALVGDLLADEPALATATSLVAKHYESPTNHWIYVGDTALHMATAGDRVAFVRVLLDCGGDPNAAGNHRRSTPLHYAADGYVVDPNWNPRRQTETIALMLASGADLHAADKNGATPLHRAVRTRCAAAVKLLLDAGSNPLARNKSGSTPFHLAVQNTGRGGSGDAGAVAEQRVIIEEFLRRRVSPDVAGAGGKTVRESAASEWIREVLAG